MSSNNTQFLQKLSGPQSQSTTQSWISVPNGESVKKLFKKTNKKQILDVLLFSAGIYAMYRWGKTVADSIDEQMPTEKSMMEMMKSMQGGPGMPPPPM